MKSVDQGCHKTLKNLEFDVLSKKCLKTWNFLQKVLKPGNKKN